MLKNKRKFLLVDRKIVYYEDGSSKNRFFVRVFFIQKLYVVNKNHQTDRFTIYFSLRCYEDAMHLCYFNLLLLYTKKHQPTFDRAHNVHGVVKYKEYR